MENFKDFVAKKMIGEKLRFKCNCLLQFDINGEIIDYTIDRDEIIYTVKVDDKITKIGENHPNMEVEPID